MVRTRKLPIPIVRMRNSPIPIILTRVRILGIHRFVIYYNKLFVKSLPVSSFLFIDQLDTIKQLIQIPEI